MANSLIIFFGVLGNIMSGLDYIYPANEFWRIFQRKSTEEFECKPYIGKLFNAYLWIYYGFLKSNGLLIITANLFGAVVEIIFLTIFLLFAPPKVKSRSAFLVFVSNVLYPMVITICMQIFLPRGIRIDIYGLICSISSMVAYLLPLSSMETVILRKSVECMPFLLSLILFLNSGVWTVYAFLLKDWYVGMPNVIGFVLGSIQLILHAMYWKSKSSEQVEQVINGLEDPLIIKTSKD